VSPSLPIILSAIRPKLTPAFLPLSRHTASRFESFRSPGSPSHDASSVSPSRRLHSSTPSPIPSNPSSSPPRVPVAPRWIEDLPSSPGKTIIGGRALDLDDERRSDPSSCPTVKRSRYSRTSSGEFSIPSLFKQTVLSDLVREERGGGKELRVELTRPTSLASQISRKENVLQRAWCVTSKRVPSVWRAWFGEDFSCQG